MDDDGLSQRNPLKDPFESKIKMFEEIANADPPASEAAQRVADSDLAKAGLALDSSAEAPKTLPSSVLSHPLADGSFLPDPVGVSSPMGGGGGLKQLNQAFAPYTGPGNPPTGTPEHDVGFVVSSLAQPNGPNFNQMSHLTTGLTNSGLTQMSGGLSGLSGGMSGMSAGSSGGFDQIPKMLSPTQLNTADPYSTDPAEPGSMVDPLQHTPQRIYHAPSQSIANLSAEWPGAAGSVRTSTRRSRPGA